MWKLHVWKVKSGGYVDKLRLEALEGTSVFSCPVER